jgi:hypothetical protein
MAAAAPTASVLLLAVLAAAVAVANRLTATVTARKIG